MIKKGKCFPVTRQPEIQKSVQTKLSSTSVGVTKGNLSNRTLDFRKNPPPDGHWHSRFIKAAIDLKEQLYNFDEAEHFLRSSTGQLDDEDIKQLKKMRGEA